MVMALRLTNAPTTFCTLMNKLFSGNLDKFVVVCLDDIVVYSKMLEEHNEHLQTMFKILQENNMNVKEEKRYFAQRKI